jgi:hypothetical protein
MNTLSPVWASEWIKLRRVRSTWWAAGGALLAMLLTAALGGTDTANELAAESGPVGSVRYTSVAISWDWLETIFRYFPNIAGETFITGAGQPYSPGLDC